MWVPEFRGEVLTWEGILRCDSCALSADELLVSTIDSSADVLNMRSDERETESRLSDEEKQANPSKAWMQRELIERVSVRSPS